jgi:metal transporter CNNM
MYISYPIVKPMGMVRSPHHIRADRQALDRMLGSGDEAITYRKAELKTFVALGVEDKLGDDELGLLGSVLEFSEKKVFEIMVSVLITSCSVS